MKSLNRNPVRLGLFLTFLTGMAVAQTDTFGDIFEGNGGTAPAPLTPVAPGAPDGVEAPLGPIRPDVTLEEVTPEMRVEDARALTVQERVRFESRVREGQRNIADGQTAMQNGQWAVAVDFFDEALTKLPNVQDLQQIRMQANELKAESYFQMARNIYERRRDGGDLNRALEFLVSAEAANPAIPRITTQITGLRSDISTFQRRLLDGREFTDIADEEQYRNSRESIQKLMARGRKEMEIGDYDTAERTFEQVLVFDRYNHEALRSLKRVAELRWQARRVERETSVMRQMAMGEERWLMPMRVDQRGPQRIEGSTSPGVVDRSTVDLENRLSQIIIREIRFEDARIQDAINFLVSASREVDPDGIGVNIIYMVDANQDAGSGGAPPAAPGPFGLPGGAPAQPAGTPRMPGVSLTARNMPLLDVLKFITEQTGLYYRVDRNAVIIERRGSGKPITRFYPVDSTRFGDVTRTLGQPSRLGPGGGVGGGGPFDPGNPFAPPTAAPAGGETDLNALFRRFGVEIGDRGSIVFEDSISQLVVNLTPDQFPKFEEVLAQINVQPRQVEIEARFVEVLQRDLEQVGFEWILNDSYQIATRSGSGTPTTRQRIEADGNPNGITTGLRFFNFDPVANSVTAASRSVDNFNPLGDVLSLRGVLTNPELQMVVHLLDQRGNSDLLSAPRVSTIAGQAASIEVVNELIYPTEFDVTQNDITVQGGGDATGPPTVIPPTVIPGGFETRAVGVILNVTPTVSPDNYTINLLMAPEIAELVDWIQYGTQVPIGDQVFVVNMPQPVFASRNVRTSMIVWDGHTVVMGGLIREEKVYYEDKIPLLGDIPLLGRLFRSEGSRSEKRNLLIFVTARLVDPAGNSVNPSSRQGMGSQGTSISTAGGTVIP